MAPPSKNPPGRIDDHSFTDDEGVLNICIGAPCSFDTPPAPSKDGPGSQAAAMAGAAVEVGASMIPGVGEAMDVYTLFAADSTLADRGLSVVSLGANVLTAGLLPNFGGWLKAGRKAADAVDGVSDAAKAADKAKDIAKAADEVAEGAEAGAKNVGGSKVTKAPPNSRKISSSEANKKHVEAGRRPPYKEGDEVYSYKTGDGDEFVRVHGPGNHEGPWMMKKSEIEGLSPTQIKDKFALPDTPTHVSTVKPPPGTSVHQGTAAAQSGWGGGGGTQIELQEIIPSSSFGKPSPL